MTLHKTSSPLIPKIIFKYCELFFRYPEKENTEQATWGFLKLEFTVGREVRDSVCLWRTYIIASRNCNLKTMIFPLDFTVGYEVRDVVCTFGHINYFK